METPAKKRKVMNPRINWTKTETEEFLQTVVSLKNKFESLGQVQPCQRKITSKQFGFEEFCEPIYLSSFLSSLRREEEFAELEDEAEKRCGSKEYGKDLKRKKKLKVPKGMRCSRGLIVAVPLTSALIILSCIIFLLSRGDCSEGNFTCKSSRTCILQRSHCDGRVDCPEGEDEDPITCQDLHGTFWKIAKKVEQGFISSNDSTCALEMIPERCVCKVKYMVICSNSRLGAVPTGISPAVQRLALNWNGIQHIKEETFDNLTHLKYLNLGNNELSYLPDNIFSSHQHKLLRLFLSNNMLTSLPHSLMKLKNLIWLFLNANNLTALQLNEWDMPNLNWLDLSDNAITLENEFGFTALPKLEILNLNNNQISRIEADTFSSLILLIDLGLAGNRIYYINENAFKNITHLEELNLKNNRLVTLGDNLFSMQIKLEKLFIGGNLHLQVRKSLIENLTKLRSLDLEGIEIPNINHDFFSSFTKLDFIYFRRFKYCMSVPHVPKCHPLSDGTSTSEDLLGSGLLRATLWLVSLFTLVTNGLVVWRRLSTSPRSISPLNIIIANLACADLLMGVYLMSIGIEDLVTQGVFRQKAAQWKSSIFCTILGVVAMISSEVSVLILLLISVERFMLISAPLSGFQTLKPKAALMTSATVWVFSVIIAILPVAEWSHSMRFYGTNSFCFPLHIDEPYLVGWQYSAFVFIGINSVSLIVIALLYVGVFVSILKTRNATTLNVNDSEFALRFFFIVLTNACCWVPIIFLKIIAFFDVDISRDVYGWLSVFVLPVNSAVNPILYTFTTPRYRTQPTASRTKSHPTDGDPGDFAKPSIWNRAIGLVQLRPIHRRSVETPRTTQEQI